MFGFSLGLPLGSCATSPCQPLRSSCTTLMRNLQGSELDHLLSARENARENMILTYLLFIVIPIGLKA